jgi:hypothetical protein
VISAFGSELPRLATTTFLSVSLLFSAYNRESSSQRKVLASAKARP